MKFKNLLFLLGSIATATALNAAIIVDGGFESPVVAGNDTLNIDTAPDVVNDLDDGWTTITGDVDILASGGNPGQWADLSDDAPNTNPQFMVNIFSAAVVVYTRDQVLQFDYELSGLSGTPDFSDNSISVELYGTNNNTLAYGTRIERGAIGTQWTAITTLSPDLTAATGGWQTAQATITAATMNSYAYYGLRVLVYNVADGGTQPGVEQLKLDNFEIVAVPEPSVYALLGGFLSLGLVIYRRQTR